MQEKLGSEVMPYEFDTSDDSYTVIDGPGYEYHEHVSAMQVFAPHYPVPTEIQQKFRSFMISL